VTRGCSTTSVQRSSSSSRRPRTPPSRTAGVDRWACTATGTHRLHTTAPPASQERGLRRRRTQHDEPRRTHPGRPHHRDTVPAHPAALGEPLLAPVGTGAAPLRRRQPRARRDVDRRCGEADDGSTLTRGSGHGPARRALRGRRALATGASSP
jgi:hypothetical protein